MQISELKLISASNIIKLRTAAGYTQAELGARLNYSDKTISKWERGEAIPDAFVLTQLGELFGVNVDFLLSSHDDWMPPTVEEPRQYSAGIIIAIAFLSIWTAAITAFVALWLFDIIRWQIFAAALPVSMLTVVVLMSVFKLRELLQYGIAAFVLSVFVALFFLLPLTRPWQIFLIAIPAVAIVFLSCNVRVRPGMAQGKKNKEAR